MNVQYLHPLGIAWRRARAVLFAPLRFETWIPLGFAAWLAGLVDAGSLAGNYGVQASRDEEGGFDFDRLPDVLSETWARILAGGAILYLAIMVGLVLFVFWLAVLWASSRGKFIFLDDVVRGRSAIVEPWRRCARLGNSLFLWQVGFGLATLVVMVAGVITAVGLVVPAFAMTGGVGPKIGAVVAAVALFGLLLLARAFIALLTEGFVIPIMYRRQCGVLEAWRRFLPLLGARPGEFVLYALLVMVLWVFLAAAVVAVGFSTCCVGFVLLALPFVGTVLLLPVHVTYRAFSLEFLAQFGEEYAVLPRD